MAWQLPSAQRMLGNFVYAILITFPKKDWKVFKFKSEMNGT
jgi:hypothetical protein